MCSWLSLWLFDHQIKQLVVQANRGTFACWRWICEHRGKRGVNEAWKTFSTLIGSKVWEKSNKMFSVVRDTTDDLSCDSQLWLHIKLCWHFSYWVIEYNMYTPWVFSLIFTRWIQYIHVTTTRSRNRTILAVRSPYVLRSHYLLIEIPIVLTLNTLKLFFLFLKFTFKK